MKIKELKINFENCEVLTIPAEMIVWFCQKDISENSYMTHNKEIYVTKVAQEITVDIKGELESLDLLWEEEKSPLQRISDSKDIVSFTTVFEDDSESEVYVIWEGNDDYFNPAQKTCVDGSLVRIEIKSNSKKG